MVQRNDGAAVQSIPPLIAGLGLGWWAFNQWQHRQKSSKIHGQVVLITGASRGLGLQLAHAFAQVGCRLAICARNEEELQWAKEELMQAGADLLAIACDVSDQSQVHQMMERVMAHYGHIDILVNNAGIIDVGPLQNTTLVQLGINK